MVKIWTRYKTTEAILNNDWQRLVVGGGWQLAVVVVGGGWWVAVGGRWWAVGGPQGLSLTNRKGFFRTALVHTHGAPPQSLDAALISEQW